MTYEAGAQWRRWDLHVHTPESLRNNYNSDWDRFIAELEALPSDFAVLGINDYLFLDGYRRLKKEKDHGRLANIRTLFPVVEFRIKKFAGVEFRNTTRINLHVIFDPDLDISVIESQFLNAIQGAYTLSPNSPTPTWSGAVNKKSLAELGAAIKKTVPKERLAEYGTDLEEGFNNLNIDEAQIFSTLESNSFLRGHYLIGIGKSEWDNIRWDDTSIAEKKDIINKAHIIFTASPTITAFIKGKAKLAAQSVNSMLLDCSDAHHFSDSQEKDRIGNCFTWIKADPTFKGLLQLVHEPEERCCIDEMPPKLALVAQNRTKYITEIQIRRKLNAKIDEVWFDNIVLPINPGLVAVIGNKGKGKSALTDIIGLLGNTKQHSEFTFLSGKNFRQPKDNKARHFEGTLRWQSGEAVTKGLEQTVDEHQPERVKYIPQNFLETICTQIGRIEETQFDHELKQVIFSHVAFADRLGKASLDELLSYKTSVAKETIRLLEQQLHRVNEIIASLEEQLWPDYREKIQHALDLKKQELETLEKSKPAAVMKPENNAMIQQEIAKTIEAIENERRLLVKSEEQITAADKNIAAQTRLIAIADRLLTRIDNLDRQVQSFFTDSLSDFEALGLLPTAVVKVENNKVVVLEKKKTATEIRERHMQQLNATLPQTLASQKNAVVAKIAQLQSQLDEPNKKYQAYSEALKQWEAHKLNIVGTAETADTIRFYEQQLTDLDNVPALLETRRGERLGKAKEIHREIVGLAQTYRDLYAAVNQVVEDQPLARETLHLKFEVGIVDSGFEDRFFDIISRAVTGTFSGIEEGHKRLESLLQSCDFEAESGIESFLTDIMKSLEYDLRTSEAKAVRVTDQIRKGKDKSVLALYDFIFSLDYLRPRYALRMGDKELHELSPGERGALLLVFYLLVDKDDVPLVIDQPEENLDNQTVFELLVPCIKMAKKRRQIFIVTHNPNLAVVCDAEQIICADLNKKDQYRMHYVPGSIENPTINKLIVDILEGTMPAFNNRDSKYQDQRE
jgi:ABC-type lipoprotein export system ATPase subunit